MVRIMAWNIERFGVNKLLNNAWDVAGMRREFIMSTIEQGNPDVFIIVEVQTNGVGGFGGLISDTSGAPGTQSILWQLRQDHPADNWCCVPPLIISMVPGYSEGVSVLFKANVLEFWGPKMWNGAASVAPVIGGGVAYDGAWAGALPNTPGPPGFNQDQMAGQCAFYDGGQIFRFPNGNSRSIWLTKFFNPATNRFLQIFTVHFPPQPPRARQALNQLARVHEVNGVLAAEDRVILGDFNINSLDPAQADIFQLLTGGPAPAGTGPVCNIVYQQMLNEPTSLKSARTGSTTGPADYFNYGKRSNAGRLLGLDNIFVARAGGAPAANGALVVNRVIGTPVIPPATYSMDMVNSIPQINVGLAPGGPRAAHFRNLFNYGHIGGGRGTSDHMAVVVDLP